MKNNFKVKVLKFSNLVEIPQSHSNQDLLNILDLMDFSDSASLATEEVEEMCLMSLQDLGPVSAAELVLKYDLGDVLRAGQIKHIANEMLEEKLWEEYPEPALHEKMFVVGSLLYKAFPKSFPYPDAVSLSFEVMAINETAKQALKDSLNESLIIRLIADGMDESSILRRLYHEQLEGSHFPEAVNIIWTLNNSTLEESHIQLNIISSGYWLDALKDVREFDSNAHADA